MQQTEINSLMTQIFDLSIKITAFIFNTKAAKKYVSENDSFFNKLSVFFIHLPT